jgi:CheY-like chemotaxis protein
MNIDPLYTEQYRAQFREYLRQKDTQAASSVTPKFLLADVFLNQRPDLAKVMPQDIGETKHPFVDTAPAIPLDNKQSISGITELSGKKIPDYTYQYVMHGSTFVPSENRKTMEDLVRKIKRSRQSCPHCVEGNLCSKLGIRCGERMQFSTRESFEDKTRPHRCNYDPVKNSPYILVVGNDSLVIDFVKNAAEMFLNKTTGYVLVASNGKQAMELLTACKMSGRRCGLVVCDINLPDMSGYDLVNNLFYRNFDTNVILLKEKSSLPFKPRIYTGDFEIIPHEPLVRAVLAKPFHSQEFVDAVTPLRKKNWV